ncbi:hypothetical protein SNEBB_000700 [Seison nebaliae]|nr:hypothetical protein SNEBB_000700 [Seison nebaliae]
MLGLVDYSSSDENEDVDDVAIDDNIREKLSVRNKMKLEMAPIVYPMVSGEKECGKVPIAAKEIFFNPKADDLYGQSYDVQIGNDELSTSTPYYKKDLKNNWLTGRVEIEYVNEFAFEEQRRNFHSFGWAKDPTLRSNQKITDKYSADLLLEAKYDDVNKDEADEIIERLNEDIKSEVTDKKIEKNLEEEIDDDMKRKLDETKAEEEDKEKKENELKELKRKILLENEENMKNEISSFVSLVNKKKKMRKRESLGNVEDIDDYRGPWRRYVDEETISRPNDELKREFDELLMKRSQTKQLNMKNYEDTQPSTQVEENMDERSLLHLPNDGKDYLNRSFIHIPRDLDDVNLKADDPPSRCFMPKEKIFTYRGHTKGIQKLELFPKSGHLFLSAGLDSRVKLWESYKERRCVFTYAGHKQSVRDVSFNRDGTAFLSASFDRFIKLWDTETGKVKGRYTTHKIPYAVKFNPDERRQHLFVAGMHDKRIITWDTRSNDIVQEYDRHLGAVNTITFVDNNRRLVSTSDDKSIRVWEWDIPVDFKYLADPSMHSMPATTLSNNGLFLAFQSMDNKIRIMEPLSNFRWRQKKVFIGHNVSGYACGMNFSPDCQYLCSGDADGDVVIWEFKSCRLLHRLKAHSKPCLDVKWLQHEESRLLSCGYDNEIHLWASNYNSRKIR